MNIERTIRVSLQQEEAFLFTIDKMKKKIDLTCNAGDFGSVKIEKYGQEHEVFYREYTIKYDSLDYTIQGHTLRAVVINAVVGDTRCNEVANITKDFTEEEELELTQLNDFKCDHCKTAHQRNKTFLFRNPEGSKFWVGSACVKKYFNDTTDTRVLKDISAFTSLEKLIYDYANDDFDKYFEGCEKSGDFFIFINQVYDLVMKEKTFYPAKYEEKSTTTRALIWDVRDPFAGISEIQNNLYNRVMEDILQRVNEDKNKFNLDMLRNFHKGKLNGTSAYAVMNVIKKENPELFKKVDVVEEFIGSVGDKIELEGVVKKMEWTQSQFGSSLFMQVICEGKRVTTYTTSSVFCPKTNKEIEVGSVIVFGSTIKDHNEFNGYKTTKVTRFKLKEIK